MMQHHLRWYQHHHDDCGKQHTDPKADRHWNEKLCLDNTLKFRGENAYYDAFLALLLFRGRIVLESMLKDSQFIKKKNFTELLGISSYDELMGISHKMPTRVKDALS